jgi:hypothetical protein
MSGFVRPAFVVYSPSSILPMDRGYKKRIEDKKTQLPSRETTATQSLQKAHEKQLKDFKPSIWP